jgi:hypothetical protein
MRKWLKKDNQNTMVRIGYNKFQYGVIAVEFMESYDRLVFATRIHQKAPKLKTMNF